MRGRKPKPTNLKILEGNPGQRPLNKNEPKPKAERLRCPGWLSKEAKREWRRIAPELYRLGLLTVVDRMALVAYCEYWAEYERLQKGINRRGRTYSSRGGKGKGSGKGRYRQQTPEVSMRNKAFANLLKLCAEFGFTPSARGRMSIPGVGEPDEGMERFLQVVKRPMG
jgi:P27 family predicted phage terminase small subunit